MSFELLQHSNASFKLAWNETAILRVHMTSSSKPQIEPLEAWSRDFVSIRFLSHDKRTKKFRRVKWSILRHCSSFLLIESLDVDSMLNPENVISLTAYNEEGKFWSSFCNANKLKSENRFLPSSPKYSFRICTLFSFAT